MMGQATPMTASIDEQGGPAGSPFLLPDKTQQNLEPGNQKEKSPQRTVRTRSQGKRRPSSWFLNRTSVVSPAGPQLTGDGKSTTKVKSPITPIISANAAEAGPEADTPSTKKRRSLSKLPIKSTKKIQSPTNDTVASSGEKHDQVDEQGGNRAAVIPATEDSSSLPSGGSRTISTQVKNRGRPRKSPIQSTDSPEGKQITRFFAGPSEARETPVQVPEGPSSKGGDDLPAVAAKVKSPITPVISANATEAGPEAETKLPIKSTKKKAMAPKAKSRTNDSVASSDEKHDQVDEQGGNRAAEIPATEETSPLPGGGSRTRSTQVKKRGRSRKSPIGSTDSPEGFQITQVFAGQTVPEGPSSKAGDAGTTKTYRKRKGKPQKYLNTGSGDYLPAAGLSSFGDEEGVSHEKTDKGTPMNMAGDSQKRTDKQSPMSKAGDSHKETDKQTPTSTTAIEWSRSSSHKFPQNPDFHPLADGKESGREGLEMVNYASSIVKKANEFEVTDSTENMNACLGTLDRLGIAIMASRDRLKKLISIRDAQEKLRGMMNDMENQIEVLTAEKIKIDEEIDGLGEGLAAAKSRQDKKDSEIGNMVNFANSVDTVFKLKITYSADSINTFLGTLLDLELHGFDITVIRDHLKMILLIKEEKEKLRELMKEVENQIEELTAEKIKIDGEIERLGEDIAAAKSRKEKKDSEIDDLTAKLSPMSELLIDAAALNVEDRAAFNDLILSVIGDR